MCCLKTSVKAILAQLAWQSGVVRDVVLAFAFLSPYGANFMFVLVSFHCLTGK